MISPDPGSSLVSRLSSLVKDEHLKQAGKQTFWLHSSPASCRLRGHFGSFTLSQTSLLKTLHHRLSTCCPRNVHWMSTECPPAVHWLSTGCPPAFHPLSTGCPHAVHTLSTECPPAVHTLSTESPPAVPTLSSCCPPWTMSEFEERVSLSCDDYYSVFSFIVLGFLGLMERLTGMMTASLCFL